MKLSLIVAPLIAAKVPHEVIMETILAFEAQQTDALEKRRANDRERQNRKRLSRDVTGGHTGSRSRARGEDSSSKKHITEKEESKKDATSAPSDLDAFKAELSSLDAERLGAIIKLRKAKRGQLTAHAAKLFIADAAAAGLSLPDAVDTCVSRNWITVKADWLAKAQPRSGAPPNRQRTYADVAMDRIKENGSASIFGNNGDVELIPPSRRESRSDDGNIRGGLGLRYAGSGR